MQNNVVNQKMAQNYKSVRVTHFINPHLFWYYELEKPNESYTEIIELEKQLEDMKQQNEANPTVGALVVVRYLRSHKLIRARVEHVDVLAGEIIVWAIDHGFPLSTKVNHIFQLPQELTKPINNVRIGGLVNTCPVERHFQFNVSLAKAEKAEKWSEQACDVVEQLLKQAKKVEVMEHFLTSNHSWVTLQLTTELGTKFRVSDYLIEMNFAIEIGQEFRKIHHELDTTKILPWMTNEGHYKFRHNNSKGNYVIVNKEADRKFPDGVTRNKQIKQRFRGCRRRDQASSDNRRSSNQKGLSGACKKSYPGCHARASDQFSSLHPPNLQNGNLKKRDAEEIAETRRNSDNRTERRNSNRAESPSKSRKKPSNPNAESANEKSISAVKKNRHRKETTSIIPLKEEPVMSISANLPVIVNRANNSGIKQEEYLKRLDERLSNELHIPLLDSHEVEVPRFEEFDEESALKTQSVENFVLAHSQITALEMIEKISDVPFCKEISKEMKNMHITKLFSIQAYSWSHLFRGNSIFIVNSPRSGKTWSYLPVVCNLVMYHVHNQSCSNAYGPIGVILVPSSSHVEEIGNLCKSLLRGIRPPVETVVSFGLRNANEVKIGLLKSCGLLIATPSSFLRLLGDNKKESLIDFKRLRLLVIDDMDMMVRRSQNELQTVVQTLFKMCRHVNTRKKLVQSFQLVVTSRNWNSTMLAMLRKSNDPLLLMSDFLEAAVYGKVKISIHLCQSEKKIDAILQFIRTNSHGTKRFLIMCNSDDDVSQVTTALGASNYICIGCSSATSIEELAIVNEWKKEKVGTSRILVCTDVMFSQLQIQNVCCVIHYSMPNLWTTFTNRFCAHAETYENHVRKNFETATYPTEENSQSLVLLDEEDYIQLPSLICFMKEHNQLIHKDILEISNRVLLAREEKRLNRDVCPHLMEFGECDEWSCHYRHNLISSDVFPKTDDIPVDGDIRIIILKVFSPTHYSARLLQQRRTGSAEWRNVRRSNEMCQFGMQMNLHYSNHENLILHWPLRIGDLCVYSNSNNFQRAIIKKVPTIRDSDPIKAIKLTVKLIDSGLIISNIKSDKLFVCHEKFKQFPSQAVDVRLLGVVPFDNERTWVCSATKSVQSWLIDYMKKGECVHANVDFALANTIWVKNIIMMKQLPTVGQYIYHVNVKRSLLENKIGEIADVKQSNMKNIAEECGLLIHNNKREIEPASESESSLIKFASSSETMDSENETESLSSRKIEHNQNDVVEWGKSLVPVCNENKDMYDPIPEVGQDNVVKDGSSFDKIANHDIKEEWIKLPLCKIVRVEIGEKNENSIWKDIFLQIAEHEQMNKFKKLLELTKEHVLTLSDTALVPFSASWFQPMQNCIVHYGNCYLRAKLYGIYGCGNKSRSIYRFFLCDYACFVLAKEKELYDNFLYPTSKEIVEFMPFQAVHCTLTDIDFVKFAKTYKRSKDYLFAYAVAEQENSSLNTLKFKINSFKIILFENETQNDLSTIQMVNTAFVENTVAKTETQNDLCTLAQFIDCFQRALQFEAEEQQSSTAGEQEKLQAVSQETKVLCVTQTQPPEDTSEALKDTSGSKEEMRLVKRINASSCDADKEKLCSLYANPSDTRTVTHLPSLKPLYKCPKTVWHDTNIFIHLTIHTPDVKEYYLKVSARTLFFAAKTPDEEYLLVLNLSFFVEPQLISHEVRGLNVIVRLVKSVPMKWARLLNQPIKYPWLQYNLNAILTDEMERILPQQQIDSILVRNEQFKPISNGSDESDNQSIGEDPTEELF